MTIHRTRPAMPPRELRMLYARVRLAREAGHDGPIAMALAARSGLGPLVYDCVCEVRRVRQTFVVEWAS